jgi:hypothetical protein
VPDGEQPFDVELKPDAEHQQDHANLGQLLRQDGVSHEARCVRAHEGTGQEIAHDRRQAQALREIPQDERRPQASGERQDQIVGMRH